MKKHQREAILISFLNEKEKYKKLAEYIVHLIRDDPSSPKESLHTIIYRIKDELRLIEKINRLNKELEAGEPQIIGKKLSDESRRSIRCQDDLSAPFRCRKSRGIS